MAEEEANWGLQNETEVKGAIEAFSQILDAMPDDRVALQTVYEGYYQLGEKEQALAYLIRLGNVIVQESDSQAASAIIDHLHELGENNDEAAELLTRIIPLVKKQEAPEAETKGKPGAPTSAPPPPTSPKKRKRGDITAAMACAWNLLQANELTQEEYSQVVQDLSEVSSKDLDVPVSVLHVLADRGATNIERVMAFLSKDSGVPIVTISNFEMQPATMEILPVDFMAHNGAMPFEIMGEDVLVALLNPYDTELMRSVEEMLGKKCHYYLITATEYDATLARIKSVFAEKEKKKQAQK